MQNNYLLHKNFKRFSYIKNIKIYNNIKIAIYLKKNFSDLFFSIIINSNIYLNVIQDYFYILVNILKYNTLSLFNQLLDICVVDNLEIKNYINRFSIYYNFLSLTRNSRIILKTFCLLLSEEISLNFKFIYKIKSLIFLFDSACWLERENWDMFGIFFEGNEDMRRILTDYSFEGFPLRKDFPLSGFFDLNYNIYEKRIIMNKIEFIQDFRFNEFSNNWIN
jgi:NADH:ubiquinone oxidoreductase subunit C